MFFAGIDLAWTYKNETGVCVINAEGELIHLSSAVYSDEDLLDILKPFANEALYIAVDAPCVVNNETGSRAVENQFKSTRINGKCLSVYASSRSYLIRTYGAIRGENLLKACKEAFPGTVLGGKPQSPDAFMTEGNPIFAETFPTGIVQGLFAISSPLPYKRKKNVSSEAAAKGLRALIDRFIQMERFGHLKGVEKAFDGWSQLQSPNKALTQKQHKHFEDMADALLCAFSAYAVFKHWAEPLVLGSPEEGFISVALLKEESLLGEHLHRLRGSDGLEVDYPPLKVTGVTAVESFEYLKSYRIDYETKSGKAAQWELCSRGHLNRLEAEILRGENFSDGTVIFAVNPEKTHVVVLREYRVSAGREVYMLPAGLSDDHEPVFETAVREFYEETGLSFKPIVAEPPRYVSVGIVNEKVTVVYGYYSGTPSKAGQADEEAADILFVDREAARQLLAHGEVCIRTAALLQMFFGLNAFMQF